MGPREKNATKNQITGFFALTGNNARPGRTGLLGIVQSGQSLVFGVKDSEDHIKSHEIEDPADIMIHARQVDLTPARPDILQSHQQDIDHPGNHEIDAGKVYDHVGRLFVEDGVELAFDAFHGPAVVNAFVLEGQHDGFGATPAEYRRTVANDFFAHDLTPLLGI